MNLFLKTLIYYFLFIGMVGIVTVTCNKMFNISSNFYDILLMSTVFRVLFNELEMEE